ncbi:hypothetical protein [Pelagicoccus sp. SDUM812003]|uniref:hypothetical protein n=1 Tax=Pelagicoccus sp. SDUM812003 TaxID=3041267 RepID=UPI0028109127|nr:hypothetical protein [Pelagicoccus sp. SDUM812003]MDQ8203039.1 hypothetical protein [Pelagicoccus sp. SDUM812003]
MEETLEKLAGSAPPAPRFDFQVGVDYTPSEKDTLAVAWIRSRFECAAVRKGSVVSELLVHDDCLTSDRFEEQLDRAVETFHFIGTKAELLIDGGLLESNTVTLPPASTRQQQAFIREKVKRFQLDQGSLIWESQRIAASKAGQRTLIHSISKQAFSELEAQFDRRGLALKKALPFTGTAGKPFKDITTPSDSASIILAPVGSTYKILAVDHAGDLQFARDLNKENGTNPQRVAVEINRCILFTRQQFGKPVSQIVTVGLQAARFKTVIRNQLQGEIPIIHRKTTKTLWLDQLANSHAFNLAHESVMQDRKRRLRKILSTCVCLILGASMLGYAYQVEDQLKSTRQQLTRLADKESEMMAVVEAAEQRDQMAAQLQAFLQETTGFDRPPIERAFLAFLSNELPADTWISELALTWQAAQSSWSLRLLLYCEADTATAERRRETLLSTLERSPFAFHSSESALDRVRKISVHRSGDQLETIAIEGVIATKGVAHAL